MYIKRKTFGLIITYLVAMIFYLGIFCTVQSISGDAYRRTAEYGYSRAFSEVQRSVEKLDTALNRGRYATGSEVSAEVCADICAGCQSAEMTMAVLPFSTQELEKTAAFINTAGDYAEYLLKTKGEDGFSDTERGNMAKLAEISGALKKSLAELGANVDEGRVLLDEPENAFADGNADYISAAMLKTESDLGDLPPLDYNGSYLAETAAKAEDPVSKKEAKKTAEDFFGVKITGTEFHTDSGIYCFSFDGGTVMVDPEGRVVSMSSQRSVAGDMESSELEAAAENFLEDKGFEEMRMTDSQRCDSVLTAEFSCADGGVLCENDCIRVSVAADDGSIYAFDATEYYRHHKDRDIGAPAVSEDEAMGALPNSLTTKNTQLMLCKDNGLERLCYAFDCVNCDGEAVRVCVDANTGKQFKIEI